MIHLLKASKKMGICYFKEVNFTNNLNELGRGPQIPDESHALLVPSLHPWKTEQRIQTVSRLLGPLEVL